MMNLKQMAGEKACEAVRNGTVVGLGTGSTVHFTIVKLGQMVREGLDIIGIPTSIRSELLAKEVGIKLTTLDEHPEVDVTIDGADEVDPNLDLIKGLGGALVREKMVASASLREVIVVDGSKMVQKLGTRSPLPVEIIQFCSGRTLKVIESLGGRPVIRMTEGEAYITDNGNFICDVHFPDGIEDPKGMEIALNNTPGIVDNGLFLGITTSVVIARDGELEIQGQPLG